MSFLLAAVDMLAKDILVIYKVKWSHKWKKSWQGPKRLQGSLYWSLFYSYVHMYTCSYVCVCVCFTYLIVHARSQSCKTLSNLRIFVHLFFFFQDRSLTGLGLANMVRLTGHWAPEICLLCLPSVGMTSVCHHTWCFHSGSVLNHNLVLNSKHFTS